MSKKFQLSNTGKLAVLVSIGLSYPAMANGIVSAGDQAHRAGVSTAANGAQIVNIVAPNQNGLSYNTYKNYDVNRQGAVLNNSLKAGDSQLAGHLSANANLDGHSAKIILNEVISRNPSLLLGKQEVFGMLADYVLSNPNGITCNGCGFINTNQSSLVVGNPVIQGGNLTEFNTMNSNQALAIGGKGLDANNAVNLIAPKIDVLGHVTAKDKINAISGQNKVAYDGQIITKNPNRVGNLDSYYLGSMKAGTINLVSTDLGSGINLKGNLDALNALSVEANGNMDIEGAKLQGGNVKVAAEKLNIHGKFSKTDDSWQDPENYHNYRGAIDHKKSSHNERLQQTQIAGKNITLVGFGDNHITAADISGDNIDIQGEKVTLDAQRLSNTNKEHNNRWYYSWFHDDNQDSHQVQQATTKVNATNEISVQSHSGDVDLVAAKLTAKDVHITAKKNIRVNATVTENNHEHKMSRKNEGSALLTGSLAEIERKQTYVPTEIDGSGNVTLNAGGDVLTLGSQIHSGGDIQVEAQKSVNIATGSVENYSLTENHLTAWGGIGGGADGGKEHKDTVTTATNMSADGKIILSGDHGVAITGSKVHAKQGGYVQAEHGTVRVDNATNKSSDSLFTRSGGAFNITGHSSYDSSNKQQASGSSVASDSNLTLAGDKHVNVTGSDISAQDHLGIESNGNVTIVAGQSQTDAIKDSTDLKGTAHAEKVSDKQYSAGIGLEHTHHHETGTHIEHNSSNLSGGTVDITSGNNVSVNGSTIDSKGDTNIAGNNVTIGSVKDTNHKNTTDDTVKVGIDVSGGADKGEISISSSDTHQTGVEDQSHDMGSTTHIGGNLNINAKDNVTQKGASHNVAGDYNISADSVTNTAGIDTDTKHTNTTHIGMDVTVGADYSETSRPLIDGAEKLLHGDVVGAVNTVKNTKVDLTEVQTGVNVNTSHTSDASVQTSVNGNQINAGNVNINVDGQVKDQSTHYQAGNNVNINADTYKNESVNAHNETTHNKVDVNVGVAVGTKTGVDIAVHGKADVHYESANSSDNLVNTGDIQGSHVAINAGNTASLEGTKITGSQGVNINGAHGVTIAQANDTHSKDSMDVKANVGVDVTTTGDVRDMGGEVGAHYKDSNSHDSHGIAGSITGGNINIHSGGDINSQGANISGNNVTLGADGQIHLTGATDSHSESSQHYGGDIHAGKNHNNKTNEFGNSIGGGIELGHSSDTSSTVTGGNIHGNADVSVTANGQGHNAISIEGGSIDGKHTNINANNGGVDVHATANSHDSSSWNVEASADTGVSHSLNDDPFKGVDKDREIGGSAGFDYSKNDSREHTNASIGGDSLNINSHGNVNIAGGNVNVTNMGGNIGGDLNIASVKDQNDSTSVNGKLTVPTVHLTSNSVEEADKAAQAAAGDKAQAEKPLTNADIKDKAIGIAKKLKDSALSGGYENTHSDKVVNQGGINVSGEANVNVAGGLNISGATVNAHAGQINASGIQKQDIQGNEQHQKVNANAMDIAKGILGLGDSSKPNFQNTNGTPVAVASMTYGKAG